MSQCITTVPITIGHAEHNDFIESFPEQVKPETGPHVVPPRERVLDHLRHELRVLAVEPQKIQDYMCYRNCFKWDNRDHVNFCLQKKCGNPGFNEAAAFLGLLKK